MAFATIQQLQERLGRTFAVGVETTQAERLLDDATALLRSIIGRHVAPQRTSTVTLHVGAGDTWIDLPDGPVTAVTSVRVDGQTVTDWQLSGESLYRPNWRSSHGPVTVTYTHGYATVPDELVRWCCVLAATWLANVEDLGALEPGNVTGTRIDDYSKSWAAGDAGPLPRHVIETLKANYGSGAHVTGFRS